MSEGFHCHWCARTYKTQRAASHWEQKTLSTGEYKRLCNRCANRRLNNPYNGLLPMRAVTASKEAQS